jgi:hypothetical protein
MPFGWPAVDPNVFGQIEKWDVPLSDWLSVKYQQGLHDTIGGSVFRMSEDSAWNDSTPIRGSLANQLYGIPGRLAFKEDEYVPNMVAFLRNQRKKEEIQRQAILESAAHSWFSGKALLGLGSSIVGSMSHPTDLALNFLPIVGSEARASGIAKVGGSRLAQGLERGLITEEVLAGRIAFPELSGAVINASVGNAIAEIPIFMQNMSDRADYTLMDSLVNVGLGGIIGGGLHLGIRHVLAPALERAGVLHRAMTPEARDLLLKAYDEANIRGESFNPRDHVALDENVSKHSAAAAVQETAASVDPKTPTEIAALVEEATQLHDQVQSIRAAAEKAESDVERTNLLAGAGALQRVLGQRGEAAGRSKGCARGCRDQDRRRADCWTCEGCRP